MDVPLCVTGPGTAVTSCRYHHCSRSHSDDMQSSGLVHPSWMVQSETMGFPKCHWTWGGTWWVPAQLSLLHPPASGQPLPGIWAMGIGSRQHKHKQFELPQVRSQSPLNCQLLLEDTSVLVRAPQRNKHWFWSLFWEGAKYSSCPQALQWHKGPGAFLEVKTAEVQKLLMTPTETH